jgi:PhzF family phenazine biosynthesis protein
MKYDVVRTRNVQLQIDAFGRTPFSGNPAAVVFQQRDEVWMQSVAKENNLAETSFLSKTENMENSYHLRWYNIQIIYAIFNF